VNIVWFEATGDDEWGLQTSASDEFDKQMINQP
jgi:hypothetical protein